jgi:hypothetical protein
MKYCITAVIITLQGKGGKVGARGQTVCGVWKIKARRTLFAVFLLAAHYTAELVLSS